MIFLGTLNQTNKRNWATAAAGLADSYRLFSLSLLLWNSFLFSVSLDWEQFGLETKFRSIAAAEGTVGRAEMPKERLVLSYL